MTPSTVVLLHKIIKKHIKSLNHCKSADMKILPDNIWRGTVKICPHLHIAVTFLTVNCCNWTATLVLQCAVLLFVLNSKPWPNTMHYWTQMSTICKHQWCIVVLIKWMGFTTHAKREVFTWRQGCEQALNQKLQMRLGTYVKTFS